jgi:hypothetical protein
MSAEFDRLVLLAKSCVYNVTNENARLIAAYSIAAKERGENNAIWHASAAVHGHLYRCPCHPCRKIRGEA